MSLKTWKEEFYPCDADSDEATAAPVAHSLMKWEGLQVRNLKRHGLKTNGWANLVDPKSLEVFIIDGSSCALCELYYDDDECEKCPLAKVIGGRCDVNGPYTDWVAGADPEPMIAALEKVLKVHS